MNTSELRRRAVECVAWKRFICWNGDDTAPDPSSSQSIAAAEQRIREMDNLEFLTLIDEVRNDDTHS